MDWFYAEGGLKVGPVTEEEFEGRFARGIIRPDTLVWREGMDDWQPFREAKPNALRNGAREPVTAATGAGLHCSQCGKAFARDQMIRFGDLWVCAGCKPAFFQRMKEGGEVAGAFRYGGFWIRALAKLIDGLILLVVTLGLVVVGAIATTRADDPNQIMAVSALWQVAQIGVNVAYVTWFLGRFGATPGKMACGLKVVLPDGERVSYLRALGRYFAELLSGILLWIGYIMAAFDDEKRSLHDRICDTRVIRAR